VQFAPCFNRSIVFSTCLSLAAVRRIAPTAGRDPGQGEMPS